jgi:hypothetical protein
MKTKTWLEIGCAAGVGLAALLADGAATAANSRAAASDTMTARGHCRHETHDERNHETGP